MPAKRKPPSARLRATAHHEAGHAVVAHLMGRSISEVTIEPSPGKYGHVKHANPLLGIELEWDGSPEATRKVEECCMISLAGDVAERIYRGQKSATRGSSGDYREATEIMDRVCNSTARALAAESTEAERNAYVKLLWLRTRSVLTAPHHWEVVEAVASALLEAGTLSGEAVRGLILDTYNRQMP